MMERTGNRSQERPIRSYILREGRMTAAQRRAMEELWPRYGVDLAAAPLDLDQLFGRRAARVVEIGFGRGDTLLELAALEPERDYLGVEVHRPGIGHLLNGIEERGLSNVRVCRADAVDLITRHLAPHSIHLVIILFPDPWPKRRHHKRRLINREFIASVTDRLAPGGMVLIATDSEPYGDQIRDVLSGAAGLGPAGETPARPILTKYERRGQARGHPIIEFAYRRIDADTPS